VFLTIRGPRHEPQRLPADPVEELVAVG